MNLQQVIRQQNCQLKNQITDLRNAFDLNRDILKVLTTRDFNKDPQHFLFMQIITRLTTLNNQTVLNNIQLIQQRNTLKQEIYRLNEQLNRLEEKLQKQLELNQMAATTPTQSRLLMHEQFNFLNCELLAANEQRIAKQHQIQYLKLQFQNLQKERFNALQTASSLGDLQHRTSKIKRKYTSNYSFKFQLVNQELEKQNKRLKMHIQELQNRLLLFIKAHNLSLEFGQNSRNKTKERIHFQKQREQIKLLKFALTDVNIYQKDNDQYMSILKRFPEAHDIEDRTIHKSWPKYKQFQLALGQDGKSRIRKQ